MTDRWQVQVLSPVNMHPIWDKSGSSLKEIAKEWEIQTKNEFITTPKLVRMSLNRSKNPFIKVFRLKEFGGYKTSSPTREETSGGENNSSDEISEL